MKKALLVFGSTKQNGNTSFLTDLFIKNFNGEVEIVNANQIKTCTDCHGCEKVTGCVLRDDFDKLYKTDYDVLILAFPIFYSNAPAPIWSLISRLNFMFNNKHVLKIEHNFKEKTSGLILLGGGSACEYLKGETLEDLPIKQAKYICRKFNANLLDENIVKVLNTDHVKIEQNKIAQKQVVALAKKLSK